MHAVLKLHSFVINDPVLGTLYILQILDLNNESKVNICPNKLDFF